jgi:hypothetical protein
MEKAYGKRYTPDCATGNSFMLGPRDMTEGPDLQHAPTKAPVLARVERLAEMDDEPKLK